MSDYILSPQISRGLSDKLYDKRKNAAIIREYAHTNDTSKIKLTISALVADFVYSVSPNARNGGLIGLAATSISLAGSVSVYLESIVPPVLMCFSDQDSRVRYYACESMYNIAKVARGSILRYFNELFDAMSKLYADPEMSVKNGAELLDRLIKDIVHEQSIAYSGPIGHIEDQDPQQIALAFPRDSQFSLPRFIPLLAERVYSKNSWTRNYLVTWIAVLDSIPDLELVSYLPDFLDGLLHFLSDSIPDVRTLTQKLLGDFLIEIRDVTELQQQQQQQARLSLGASMTSQNKDIDPLESESTGQGKGSWIPGQGVKINFAKIVKILKPHLTSSDEDMQETALRWINEFMSLAKDVMIQFTPALIPAVLPSLAHNVDSIRIIANETNLNLFRLVYESALPPEPILQTSGGLVADKPTNARSQSPRPQSPKTQDRSSLSFGTSGSIASKLSAGTKDQHGSSRDSLNDRSTSPVPTASQHTKPAVDQLEFDYVATVNALTLQFLNEHEQTRVASLEWLLMLHKRAPHLILSIDDGSFPVLLKTLSDPSEEVIKRDLQLLAQISSHSDDTYFTNFMINLLSLFSTDRRLLENRGSVIIRQLCVSLNSERIYRTLAEILEKDEDLEFANTMVQNLNIILITAPELADLRKRLKTVDSRDGQALFSVLYRSWCHNPVSTFALCLMAQYYEHAVALLQSFAEFEITVNLLIQVDKLVQLIESPVFTYLRLQLLEPEKYPHLFKCLYGLLMLLPQSTAFATLRNRLTSVSSMGFIHLVPKAPGFGGQGTSSLASSNPRSKAAANANATGPQSNFGAHGGGHHEGPRFPELLSHFRTVQSRHERSRRQAVQALLRQSTYGASNVGSVSALHFNQHSPYHQQQIQRQMRRQSSQPQALPKQAVLQAPPLSYDQERSDQHQQALGSDQYGNSASNENSAEGQVENSAGAHPGPNPSGAPQSQASTTSNSRNTLIKGGQNNATYHSPTGPAGSRTFSGTPPPPTISPGASAPPSSGTVSPSSTTVMQVTGPDMSETRVTKNRNTAG
ncbi:hypothetical protein BGW38_007416 [Lunasporangiospora selenospora]|uniref:Vacuolar protein 14 C-terminal Fig4-binding domain-containing protein n=1 Tax=Lunasporangiospora selenospora TaxID=979761 RepID=A0A9P6KIY6_9FUNG|nr:hypothetical protein BGW38_007416 [Lunasporangiospora selenospora]